MLVVCCYAREVYVAWISLNYLAHGLDELWEQRLFLERDFSFGALVSSGVVDVMVAQFVCLDERSVLACQLNLLELVIFLLC